MSSEDDERRLEPVLYRKSIKNLEKLFFLKISKSIGFQRKAFEILIEEITVHRMVLFLASDTQQRRIKYFLINFFEKTLFCKYLKRGCMEFKIYSDSSRGDHGAAI